MKIKNPQIDLLLGSIHNLIAFAKEAASAAAQDVPSPVGGALTATPETDALLAEYEADEQADRGALFKGAVIAMEAKLAELKTLDVLVEAPQP